MRSSAVYLTSDVHLGAIPEERAGAFRRWLDFAAERASEIVINGDLFDFWFEYRHAIPRGHTRVLGALSRIVDGGVPVRLLGGNHDWWGGSFLQDEVGVTFHREPVTIELGGLRTFLAHGDGVGVGDLGYRMLRGVLRGRPTRWAFRWLHPDVGAWIARRVSATPTHAGVGHSDTKARSDALERWATDYLRSDPSLDLVSLGHTHVPLLREVEPGRWYLNSGDWVHHQSYAILERGGPPRLLEWEG